jgi:hypothetical protein
VETTSTSAAAAATTAAATTTEPAATSTTAAATTTTAAVTTTTVPSTVLDDGRPATFLAITDDYEAVEVDTVTGQVVHSYGQTGTLADLQAAEEMAPNVLVGVWRTKDGSMVGISDCCEPAAGRVWYLDADDDLGEDPYTAGSPWNTGWQMAASPIDNRFAVIGYELQVFDPAGSPEDGFVVWIDEPDLGFPMSAPAWDRDGSGVYWLTGSGPNTSLALVDFNFSEMGVVADLDWVEEGQYLDGIGMQASGNLVGFQVFYDEAETPAEVTGLVFSPTGELQATFTVEDDSRWGGYDQSGTFLIYVDGDGIVRWQGLGQSGVIADGYLFASW